MSINVKRISLLIFSLLLILASQVHAAEKIFPCPPTGSAYTSSQVVIAVTNPDESVTEWRLTSTVFPQGSSQVSEWTKVGAKHSSVSTELKCEQKIEGDPAVYTTAVTDIEPKWKPCSVFDLPETANKGFRCLSK